MMRHVLNCDPEPFAGLVSGDKTFEFRVNDRDFKVGDILELKETKYASYEVEPGQDNPLTGAQEIRRITHILRGPSYNLPKGFCILSIGPITRRQSNPLSILPATGSNSGKNANYYDVFIASPVKEETAPYTATCLDIIDTLGMSFAEGEAFKAIWRKAAARQGNEKDGHAALYDAEKARLYGALIEKQELDKLRGE